MSNEMAEKLPDHNVDCQRDLSDMNKVAIRAAVCSKAMNLQHIF